MSCKLQALNLRKNRSNLTFDLMVCVAALLLIVQVRVGPVSCAYSRLVIPGAVSCFTEQFRGRLREAPWTSFSTASTLSTHRHSRVVSIIASRWAGYGCKFFFLWRIRTSGLFAFRINLKLQWILQTVELLGRAISTSQGRYLHKTTQTQNKRKYPCLEWD
jgi:hypothetical protein